MNDHSQPEARPLPQLAAECHLRPATIADLAQVSSWFTSAQQLQLWAGPYVPWPPQLDDLIEQIDFLAQPAFSLHLDNQGLAGFAQLQPRGALYHFARVAIAPDWRSRGYGGQLLAAIMARYPAAPGFSLYVYRHNDAAWHCYRKLGFEQQAEDSTTAADAGCVLLTRLTTARMARHLP